MSTSDEAVVVWGEVLWDRFPGGTFLGGAPANVAWHVGQGGGWPQLVTRVGTDLEGQRAIDTLSMFVDTSLVQLDTERATGEVTVSVIDGEPRYQMHTGRAWERIACPPHTARAIGLAGVLVYGTLSQRTPEGLAGWEAAIAAASRTCMKVCDINLRRRANGSMVEDPHVVERALSVADVIKVNDNELATLATTFGWADPIATLRDGGRRTLAVTHGANGSTLYGTKDPISIPGVAARPGGDNVGCGDAYIATLVLGMTMGWDLAASGRAASRYAAAVAEVSGATPVFEPEHVAQLLGLDVDDLASGPS